MWGGRAALILNGIGDPGSQKGASTYASHPQMPTARSVQQTHPGLLWFGLIERSAQPKNSQSGQQSNIILDVAKLAGHAQPLRALPFARQPSRSQRALVSPKSFRKSAHLHQIRKCAQRIVGSD